MDLASRCSVSLGGDLVAELATIVKDMPFPNLAGDGCLDAALASASLGRTEFAIEFAAEALRLAEAKGNH